MAEEKDSGKDDWKSREISENEARIRKLTKLYYSNPKIQEALLNFSKNREVVPRYFEGFGKRPDSLNFPGDIMGLVMKGATSFHASEELWNDALQLNSDMGQDEMHNLRKGWDLLIDIDSPYLDLSKIAASLVVKILERYGVKNYGIKFSGSKGFHIIVPGIAFPPDFQGQETKKMFPEWPRAITQFLFYEIEPAFRREAGKIMSLESKKEDGKAKIYCNNCDREAKRGSAVKFSCPVCGMIIERKDFKLSKRRLKCLNEKCAGVLEIENEKEYYYCENCKDPENPGIQMNSFRNKENFVERRGDDVGEHAKFDLVLVAPRHLFRMPYSLHEKTSLSSAVLKKEELPGFSPRDANPLKIEIRDFLPQSQEGEAKNLLSAALEWKRNRESIEEKIEKKKYSEYLHSEVDSSKIKEEMFPLSIKKLLKGMKDGRKRGLFILITFFRSLGFSGDYINARVREWNKLNEVPLKEGYIKGQVDWHLKQKKKILPPNYNNQAFYEDLGLLDKKPNVKNPLVEVLREVRKNS